MERRRYPRITTPLEIELSHPLIGRRTAVARDITDEGVFVWYADAPFRPGNTLSITSRTTQMIESRPTPTVKMKVLRVAEDGFALGFLNRSGAHLWRSAAQQPQNLEVGKNLFRVFQAAVIRDQRNRILTVQQNGRWLFPGDWLQTGNAQHQALCSYLSATLNLTGLQFLRTVLTHISTDVIAQESSVLSIFHLYSWPDNNQRGWRPAQLTDQAPYSKISWVAHQRQLDEMSFSAEPLRALTRALLHENPRVDDSVAAQQEPTENRTVDAEDYRRHG